MHLLGPAHHRVLDGLGRRAAGRGLGVGDEHAAQRIAHHRQRVGGDVARLASAAAVPEQDPAPRRRHAREGRIAELQPAVVAERVRGGGESHAAAHAIKQVGEAVNAAFGETLDTLPDPVRRAVDRDRRDSFAELGLGGLDAHDEVKVVPGRGDDGRLAGLDGLPR